MPLDWRADHIGSFLRPQQILQARDATSPEKLAEIEDANILRILALQQESGFNIFTDGELRRRNFMSDFTDAVSGFDLDDAVDRPWDASLGGAPASRVAGIVKARIKKLRSLTLHELDFLQQNAPGPVKMTMPSATQFPAIAFKKGVTDRVYADYSDLLRDITAIVRDEMQQLAARKVDYIQIDAPRYSYYLDPKWREWMQHEMGLDPEATLDEALAADNQCFQAAPRRHPRHPSLSRQQPQPLVRPGRLRCHRRKALLHPRRRPLLTRRIDAASKYILLEHLALSPQCGFASTMEGNLLTEDEQWAKLRLVAETARKIWA